MRTIFSIACVFFLTSSIALAAPADNSPRPFMGDGSDVAASATVQGSTSVQGMGGDDSHDMGMGTHIDASSSMRMGGRGSLEALLHGSTTLPHPIIAALKIDARLLKDATLGTVTSVGADSFTIEVPGSKEHATSSVTVTTTASTKFNVGSSTASGADVTTGTHVLVLGKKSVSTHTVAAERVIMGGKDMEAMNPPRPTIVQKIKKVLFGKMGTASSTSGAQVGADVEGSSSMQNGGLVHTVLNALFGWIR